MASLNRPKDDTVNKYYLPVPISSYLPVPISSHFLSLPVPISLPFLAVHAFCFESEVRYITTLRANGTIIAAVGKPTNRPIIQARSQVDKNSSDNPRFAATMTNDITRLIPKATIKLTRMPANFGLIFIIRGFFLQKELFNFPWLLWLGLKPIGFATYDYFPIFPYFGLVLIGIGLGKTLYNKKKRNFKLINLEKKQVIKQFCFLGRHSLIIYLIHIPILLIILYFL